MRRRIRAIRVAGKPQTPKVDISNKSGVQAKLSKCWQAKDK